MTLDGASPSLREIRFDSADTRYTIATGSGGTITLDGGARTGVALLLAAVPVPLVAALLIRLDRFEPEPTRLLVRTFLWGAGAATFVALVINSIVEVVAGSGAAAVISARENSRPVIGRATALRSASRLMPPARPRPPGRPPGVSGMMSAEPS